MKDNLCPYCDRTGKVKQDKALTIINDTYVHYIEKYYKCKACGTEWYSAKMVNSNLMSARKAYKLES